VIFRHITGSRGELKTQQDVRSGRPKRETVELIKSRQPGEHKRVIKGFADWRRAKESCFPAARNIREN
jgi:hypothetical protein